MNLVYFNICLWLAITLFWIFYIIRSEYTSKIIRNAHSAIYKYKKYFGMISNIGDMFDLLSYTYTDYFWKFWLWGKYSGIKREYVWILKEFFEDD